MLGRIGRYVRQQHLGLLALCIVFSSSSAYAATRLAPRNSVGSPQVVNGSLQTADLSKKARRALKGNRGRTGPRGAQGVAGAQGPQGATGPQGAVGATGPAGTNGTNGINGTNGTNGANGATNVVVRQVNGTADAEESAATASCNAGERAVGGGASYSRTGLSVPRMRDSFPIGGSTTTPPTGWSAVIDNDGTGTVTAFVYVVCSSP